MSELKHTKGEWELDGNGVYPKGKGYSIALVSTISPINTKFKNKEEEQANAKLIVAAPDVLEALILAKKDLMNFIADKFTPLQEKQCIEYMKNDKTYQAVLSAIKKATE